MAEIKPITKKEWAEWLYALDAGADMPDDDTIIATLRDRDSTIESLLEACQAARNHLAMIALDHSQADCAGYYVPMLEAAISLAEKASKP